MESGEEMKGINVGANGRSPLQRPKQLSIEASVMSKDKKRELPKGKKRKVAQTNQSEAKAYRHTEADSPLRPDVGTQAQFRKKNPQRLTDMILHFRQRWIGMGKIPFVTLENGSLR